MGQYRPTHGNDENAYGLLTHEILGEISGSHSGKYEDCLLGCFAPVACYKFTDVSDVFVGSVIRTMGKPMTYFRSKTSEK